MAKKATTKRIKNSDITITLPTSTLKLPLKYSERAILPCAAIDSRYRDLLCQCKTTADRQLINNVIWETTDNRSVRVTFLATYNNSDNYYNEELDDLCKKCYGEKFSFDVVSEVWRKRLGRLDNYWDLIELK